MEEEIRKIGLCQENAWNRIRWKKGLEVMVVRLIRLLHNTVFITCAATPLLSKKMPKKSVVSQPDASDQLILAAYLLAAD